MDSAGVWAVLQRFGLEYLMDELNGDKIHRLENIITLRPDLHSLFDTLDLWLEEDQSTANRYKICFSTGMRLGFPVFVTFTTPDPEHLPLPSPDLLLLHAVCARVAHLFGAGEYVDEILKDLEETRVLSPTGESAELLFHALAPLGIPVR
ncbi:hypothetical protein BJ138DRAFT_1161323 [Hygrophoropsis aurantiaca]|uniref:Uncharacterized protein n=1 Tax=Hygrophoropsis aurantiaca TaxID=72124 RepID=A0ACB8A2V6_9AGAM|nr:hypothetical protein BJ138DRAFT_1161323 [Hygrophoropsis aurantiaca]